MKVNSVALVTGVSRHLGIGKAICLELAKQGFDIFFTYWLPYDRQFEWGVKEQEPAEIQQEIRALGVQCERLEFNLSQSESIPKLFTKVVDALGGASILINNATVSTSSDIESITGAQLYDHFEINVKATTLLIKSFLQQIPEDQSGRIVNLTSGQSQGPMSGEIAYAMTKAAIEMLTKTIAIEIAKKGVTINAVNPGPTDTGWMNPDLEAVLTPMFPTGRVGLPKDAAQLIAFLCSKEGGWITGQVIHSEGGFNRYAV